MENCIFCEIISGTLPAKVVYEDEYTLAFEDISPVAPVHVLVVPKKHIGSLLELNTKDSFICSKLFEAVQKVAALAGTDKNGFRTIINTGKSAGQTVEHLHIHVIGGRELGVKLCD